MRIRVYLPVLVIVLALCLLDSVIIVLTMLNEDIIGDSILVCLIIFFLAALPFGLLIWCLLTMSNIIEFDDKGVRRIRFGKVIRDFSWNNVVTVGYTNDDLFVGWAYISEKEKKYNSAILSVTKMRLDKEVIYFHMSKKAQVAIQTYVPKKFINNNSDNCMI